MIRHYHGTCLQVTATHYSDYAVLSWKHMPTDDDESEDYRTSIVIPKTLQKAVAHYCIDHEMTFTDAVIAALNEYLARHERSSK